MLSAIALLFIVLGIGIFATGLFSNNIIKESYLPKIVHDFIRYGRASVPSQENASILEWIQVPKSWFAHFYMYSVLVQLPIFYTLVTVYILDWNPLESKIYVWLAHILDALAGSSTASKVTSPAIALLASFLFLIHVVRRFYETKYVMVYSDTKMNVVHYLLAFVHYTASMLSLISINPGLAGKSSHRMTWDWNQVRNEFVPMVGIGLTLFIYASVQQYKAHVTFANLRKMGRKVVTQRHKIPRGGLFELVSCPNYWAEILIYTSFALIFSFQNICWNAALFWVVCNQVTAGVMNHIWYKRKFPEYPKNRKAVIPYVW